MQTKGIKILKINSIIVIEIVKSYCKYSNIYDR